MNSIEAVNSLGHALQRMEQFERTGHYDPCKETVKQINETQEGRVTELVNAWINERWPDCPGSYKRHNHRICLDSGRSMPTQTTDRNVDGPILITRQIDGDAYSNIGSHANVVGPVKT